MKNICQSDIFKDYTDKVLAHLDNDIQNDPNVAKIDLLLPGIIQHVNSIKESQTNMHCDLKEDIQKIISHKREDVTTQKIKTTVKQSLTSTLAKLGRCMAILEGGDRIEMGKIMEDIEVKGASCDEQSYTPTSTADNKIGDEFYTVPKTFPNVESIMLHWYKYADVNEKRNGSKWRFCLNSTKRKIFTRFKRIMQGWNNQLEEYIYQEIISEIF